MPGPTIPPTLAKAFIAFLSVLVVLAALFGFLLFGPFDIFSDINKMADLLNESRGGSDRGRPSSPEVAPSLAREVSDAEPVMVDITTEPRIVSFDNPGESVRLTLRGYYSDGTVGQLAAIPGAELTFTSTDPDVAQVSSDGVVTGVEAGGVDVEVSYGGFTAEVPVLVFEPFEPLPAIDPERVVPNADDGTAIVLNQLMVELQPEVSESEADSIADSIGGRIVYRFESFSGVVIENDARTEAELSEALILLEGDPRVVTAYPDILFEPSQGPISTGIETLDNLGNNSAYVQSGMKEAWELLNASKQTLDPVVIAVIDTAFPIHHTGRSEEYKLLNQEFEGDKIKVINLRAQKLPDYHHGAAVTSVMVAENDSAKSNVGISGVVTSVNDLDYEVLFFEAGAPKPGEPETEIDGQAFGAALSMISVRVALQEVDGFKEPLDVVNLSLSFHCHKAHSFDCNEQNVWHAEIGKNANVIYVAAAGNAKESNNHKSVNIVENNVIPASFTMRRGGGNNVRMALDNIIAVAGTRGRDSEIQRDPRSNYGNAVTLGAPHTVKVLDTRKNDISGLPGTSMASPLVSGTVALMKAVDPSLLPEEIKQILVDTGDPVYETKDGKQELLPWKALNAGAAVRYVMGTEADIVDAELAILQLIEESRQERESLFPEGVPTYTPVPTSAPSLRPEPPHATATQAPPPPERRNQPPGSRVWVKEMVVVPPTLAEVPQGRSPAAHRAASSPTMSENRLVLHGSGNALFFELVSNRPRSVPVFRSIGVKKTGRELQFAGAMDATTGDPSWRLEIESATSTVRQVTYDGQPGRQFESVGGSGGKAVHPITEGVLWTFPSGKKVRVLRLVDGIVYIDSDSTLLAIDPDTGHARWHHEIDAFRYDLWFNEGVIYLGTPRGLTALEATSGDWIWHYEHDSLLSVSTIQDGTVYAGTVDTVVAIDAEDGIPLWRYERSNRLYEESSVEAAGEVVFLGAWARDSVVYAIDGAQGVERWAYGEMGTETRLSTIEDGVAYLKLERHSNSTSANSGWRDAVVAVDAFTGQHLWRLQNDGFIRVRSVHADTALVDVTEGIDRYFERFLYAVNRDKGEVDWRYQPPFDLPKGRYVTHTFNDVWYVTAFRGNDIDALTAIGSDGNILWKYPLDSGQPILDVDIEVDNNTVYVGMIVQKGSVYEASYEIIVHAIQR